MTSLPSSKNISQHAVHVLCSLTMGKVGEGLVGQTQQVDRLLLMQCAWWAVCHATPGIAYQYLLLLYFDKCWVQVSNAEHVKPHSFQYSDVEQIFPMSRLCQNWHIRGSASDPLDNALGERLSPCCACWLAVQQGTFS